MSRPNTQISHTAHTEQRILNDSYDPDFDVLVTESLEYDPAGNLKRAMTKDLATRVVISGTDIYIGKATAGSAVGSPVWQVKHIDTASDIIITWADGDTNFDNSFSSPAGLSYS